MSTAWWSLSTGQYLAGMTLLGLVVLLHRMTREK